MFPVKGGMLHAINKKIWKHEQIPVISTERICIRSCGEGNQYFIQIYRHKSAKELF